MMQMEMKMVYFHKDKMAHWSAKCDRVVNFLVILHSEKTSTFHIKTKEPNLIK